MTILENKSDGDEDLSFRWGTWEELLLAFAVNRYGTSAWPSIASELQKRSSGQNLTLTAQNCRQKYIDLKRRYVSQNDDESVNDDDSNDGEMAESVSLLEELRKLRVAELRLEVQRYDLNIESLESKMKRMEEARERSTTREKIDSDLDIKKEEIKDENDNEQDVNPLPESVTGGEILATEEWEKDRMSVNESNSTDLGTRKLRTSATGLQPDANEDEEVERETTRNENEESTEPVRTVRDNSCNGSSNILEKESGKNTTAEQGSESRESRESSEAESKRGEEDAAKEASDVQSSATRSRKEGSDKVRCGSTSGDERDHGVQSLAVKKFPSQSQPFIDFLQAISAHKLSSIFRRRLKSQESSKYQKLILQHVDLETIETRLKEGWYSGSASKFFRDLLLLVNNALIFFSKNSSEAKAAVQIRQLISNEMSKKFPKLESSSRKQISLQSLPAPSKEDNDPSRPLLLKPGISNPLIFCRKRSSIAAKASSRADNNNKQKEQAAELAEEKDSKLQPSQLYDDAEDPKIRKRRTRDRFTPVSVKSKKTGKNQGNNNDSKNPETGTEKQQGKGGSTSQQSDPKRKHLEKVGSSALQSEPKVEKKKSLPMVDSKKRGAANFLNRMKQSSTDNGVLLDALKSTPLTNHETTKSKGGSAHKKNDNTKWGEMRDQVITRGSESKQDKEKGNPVKRNVGRPPKKGAPPPPPPASGKRGRERSETEIVASKHPKKKSRKS